MTDQTGGWAALRLTGPMAAEALMRLVPLDLRKFGSRSGGPRAPGPYADGADAGRDDGFTILVFRSMARTAWHEIEAALKMLAARKAL